MKYARSNNYGTQVRIVDIVSLPSRLPAWAADGDAFIAKMYPGVTGFFQVHDAVENCAVVNGDGTYTNPDGGTVDADGNVTYPDEE